MNCTCRRSKDSRWWPVIWRYRRLRLFLACVWREFDDGIRLTVREAWFVARSVNDGN